MAKEASDGAAGSAPRTAAEVARAALGALFARLAAGSDDALSYERLRLRLIAFFRLRFPAQAESLADEALDRLGRRLADGTPVESPAGYALGIARLLVLETSAKHKKEAYAAREAMREAALHSADAEPDPAVPALSACLEALAPDAATFILDYYAAVGGASRIEGRQRLAALSGMSLNALRNRALRIRLALEKCVKARLASDENPESYTRDMLEDGAT